MWDYFYFLIYHYGKSIIKVLFAMVIISSLSLFWYFKAPGEMVSGHHQPQYLPKTDYLNIGIRALKLMYYNLGLPVLAFLTVTVASSLFHKKYRYISIVMVIIPTIIWMFKHSVDFMNLSFVIPFLFFVSAVGLAEIFCHLTKNKKLLPPIVSINKIENQKIRLNKSNKLFLVLTFLIAGFFITCISIRLVLPIPPEYI